MVKTLSLGLLTLAFSFFVGVSYINAQEATNTPTPTATETPTPTPSDSMQDSDDESDEMPESAPKTGFGF